MRVIASALMAALLLGCPATPPVTEVDAGEEPFDGETEGSGGGIPQFDPDAIDAGDPVIDAGMVVVDTRCCDTVFSVSDEEPVDAVGVLEGDSPALAGGLSLTRGDAGWSASACFPLNSSSFYWYRFSWDGGLRDAGTFELEDGGTETLVVMDVVTRVRASDREPSFESADGTRNYYRAVSSCDGLDGSVPSP
jgi:hypothetical protein